MVLPSRRKDPTMSASLITVLFVLLSVVIQVGLGMLF
jgi:hypothetical protein